ncbi:hypothetical protein NQ314_013650 [Rhamnusium bicolor]|uniref:Uncharacterized protein n=1 Tax=Rhamnusium bicolor TaxID=1586634 RepID=A0AAV8X522_9CUCU|nr:hypothetical protein NQ314_013650 [Rhamnusium bicolor]
MDYIDTCWVTTALSGLLFFMLVLLLLSTITSGGDRVPRCIVKEEINNNTIHLVHSHDPGEWQSIEVELFEKIVQNYPNYKIHLILIQRNIPKRIPKYERSILEEDKPISTLENDIITVKTSIEKNEEKVIVKRDTKRKKRTIDDLRLSINMGAKRLLDILLHGKVPIQNSTDSLIRTPRAVPEANRIKTLNDVLKTHTNIILENTTFNQVFYMSPLYAYWPFLNENLKVFAVRVLQLWQYGGISFDLEPTAKQPDSKVPESDLNNETSAEKDIDNIFNRKLFNFIISEKKNYEKLPTGVVTADDEALHMESKIPCHAFFGEIMMNLRRAQDDTTVKDILQESLRVFCKHSAADKKYCDILTKIQ